ncbi:hypothetical protein [Pseudoclavibacter sp. VKM Ac-2888]|uniref:hypothetical protein n=1 Tax=Pseudoclavibacter sp. VKM Ac-2888 TaxID=2783830 RepID=UPI00188BE97A|nr:hypothetical protein [Pseudoclavibacter sp. VKM Ac-2888]MBF4549668.1 hypothetical protein [Pseudoclavibacter sp. VKM Ac-2888]
MHAARDKQAQTSPRGHLFADEVNPEGDPQNGYGAFEWQVSTRTNYAVKAIELARAEFERELTTGSLKSLDEDAKRFARAGLIYEVTKVPR